MWDISIKLIPNSFFRTNIQLENNDLKYIDIVLFVYYVLQYTVTEISEYSLIFIQPQFGSDRTKKARNLVWQRPTTRHC